MEPASRDFPGVDGSLLLPGGVRENCVGRAGLPPGGQLLTILLRNDSMEVKHVVAGNKVTPLYNYAALDYSVNM